MINFFKGLLISHEYGPRPKSPYIHNYTTVYGNAPKEKFEALGWKAEEFGPYPERAGLAKDTCASMDLSVEEIKRTIKALESIPAYLLIIRSLSTVLEGYVLDLRNVYEEPNKEIRERALEILRGNE